MEFSNDASKDIKKFADILDTANTRRTTLTIMVDDFELAAIADVLRAMRKVQKE